RATHDAFVRESRKLKGFCRPNFAYKGVRAEPQRRHVRQHPDDRVRRSIQCNAASDYVRIATEPLLPEDFRDQRHIGTLFFVTPKIPPEDRTDAKDVEI